MQSTCSHFIASSALRLLQRHAPLTTLSAHNVQQCLLHSAASAPQKSSPSLPSEPLVPAAPGTVPYCDTHLVISTPASPEGADKGSLWPPVVERSPAFLEAFKAIAKLQEDPDTATIEVKLTASESTTLQEEHAQADADQQPTVDVLVFPDGYAYTELPLRLIQQVVKAHTDGFEDLQDSKEISPYQEPVRGVHLFVCCHGARSKHCGSRGNALLQRFERLLQGMEESVVDKVHLHAASCVGGCQFAGNVLVYGAVSPCDGDWFGGINKTNAAQFLDALVNMEISGEGGPADPMLRELWRGRTGLTPEEQIQFFENPDALFTDADDADVMAGGVEGFEGESEGEEDFSDAEREQAEMELQENAFDFENRPRRRR